MTTKMPEQQSHGPHVLETAGGSPWTGSGTRVAGLELPEGLGHHAVYRGERDYRVSTWPGEDASTVMLRKVVEGLECYRRTMTRSWGECNGVYPQEAVPQNIVAMICAAKFPTVSKDVLVDAQVHNGLTEDYDPGYKGDLWDYFTEEFQQAVRMTHTGDAYQRVYQVKTRFFPFLHGNDWAGERNIEG